MLHKNVADTAQRGKVWQGLEWHQLGNNAHKQKGDNKTPPRGEQHTFLFAGPRKGIKQNRNEGAIGAAWTTNVSAPTGAGSY